MQFIAGIAAFLYPQVSTGLRVQLAPYHMFLGRTVYVLGLANMCVSAPTCSSRRCSASADDASLPHPLAAASSGLAPPQPVMPACCQDSAQQLLHCQLPVHTCVHCAEQHAIIKAFGLNKTLQLSPRKTQTPTGT